MLVCIIFCKVLSIFVLRWVVKKRFKELVYRNEEVSNNYISRVKGLIIVNFGYELMCLIFYKYYVFF